ncbi:hypothetical protein BDZ94DRAFT_1200535, partial [Collybia nuda]
MSQNILVIGGSRNIGYVATLKFLSLGANATFLLRSPSVFDQDVHIQGYVKSGKVRLVKGDALNETDVQRAWNEASAVGTVDVLLFTVGGEPKFHPTKGFVISPVNLVTQCLLNALCTMPRTSPQPRIIAITSVGLTRTSHAALPLALKALYSFFLASPHKDKIGVERIMAHCAGWEWDTREDGNPGEAIMGPGDWKTRTGLPEAGTLKRVLVIRPAMFTDGESVGDKGAQEGKKGKGKEPYRVSEAEIGGYTISRKDVAHFVVDAVTNRWDEFEGRRINICY